VKHFFTINEFRLFVDAGHHGIDADIGGGKTYHTATAPGLTLPQRELNQVRHHAVLGHGLAVQAIRTRAKADTKVGFAEVMFVRSPRSTRPSTSRRPRRPLVS
jgi:beta-glucosidase